MMNSRPHVSILEEIEFFRGIEEPAKLDILAQATGETVEEAEYLFLQGDSAENMYVVLEGRIRLSQTNPDGQTVIHQHPGPGEAFGVIAVLRSIEFPVSAQAVETSRLLRWDKQTVTRLMLSHPQLALNAINILAKFMIDFQERIQQLSRDTAESRIAHSLLRLASQAGRVLEGDAILIEMKLTRQQISDMSGTTLFTASRIMSRWEKEGILAPRKRGLLLSNPGLLQEIAKE